MVAEIKAAITWLRDLRISFGELSAVVAEEERPV
jgi:hypothetical protein